MAGPLLTDVSFNDDRFPISNKEKETGYFSDAFKGRPRLLSVDSNPKAAAISPATPQLQTVVADSRLCAMPCEETKVSRTIVHHARSFD
jgi:hypothetical protein